MKRIRIISQTAILALLSLIVISCGDTSFSKVGIEFLDSAFGYSNYTAKNLLSNNISVDGETDKLSSSEKKDAYMEVIKELKDELPGIVSDFKYRYGFTYDTWCGKGATAFYSYGSNKEYLIVLDFDQDYSDEWKIDDIDIHEIQYLNSEYKYEIERLAKCIEEGEKENIKSQKQSVKQMESLINSIKDLMSESQLNEFKEIKSGK